MVVAKMVLDKLLDSLIGVHAIVVFLFRNLLVVHDLILPNVYLREDHHGLDSLSMILRHEGHLSLDFIFQILIAFYHNSLILFRV